mmetsp:Transcript_25026/g.54446  ORF Transcript_25026/g.54446 Transcript_25026/m.54446 type:complete len:269 (+) Transcript_25026:1252-2058(+)
MRQTLGQNVQRRGHIVDALHGWNGDLLKVRQSQELEGVRGGEAGKGITFMDTNRSVDIIIRHLSSDASFHVVHQEVVHNTANFRAAWRLTWASSWEIDHVSLKFSVVLATNGVLEHVTIVCDHRPHHLDSLVVLQRNTLSQLLESVLHRPPLLVDLLLDLWQHTAHIPEEDGSELVDESLGSDHARRQLVVDAMVVEPVLFFTEGFLDRLLVDDVLLRPHLHADVAVLQGNVLTSEDLGGICALVHDVDLRDNTDGSNASRIDKSDQL